MRPDSGATTTTTAILKGVARRFAVSRRPLHRRTSRQRPVWFLYSTSPPCLADVPTDAVFSSAPPDLMSFPLLLIVGAAFCGWALLRCIGNECDRRVRL